MFPRGISVVIPNYNGKELLRENLPAVFEACHFSGLSFEIIVSDDCSFDDSIAFVYEAFPQVTVVENPVNGGFSKNINAGIRIAKYAYVLLLNSDVKLTVNYFDYQLSYLEQSRVFGVQGKIMSADGLVKQDAAKFPQIKTNGILATKNCDTIAGNEPLLTFFLSGANALVDHEKLRQLGGFDEIFSPFYFEDVDLGIRAWRNGWECWYEPRAVCFHPLSSTINKSAKQGFIQEITTRNKMLLNTRHLAGLDRLKWFISLHFKVLFAVLIGKRNIYNAFKAFKTLKGSGKELESTKPLRVIIRQIKQSYHTKNITTF